jgi:non-canonical purine NTP pyrophosphatase (RdgB/HAM1 family)
LEVLVATRSAGKIREIRRILSGVPGLVVRDLDELGIDSDPAEDDLEPYESFEENALSKARYFFEKSGIPTVADDSGIEVDALDGAPGVRSKRFAPEARVERGGLTGQALDDANNRHLVELLAKVTPADRTARYVCVAVLVEGDADPLVIRGEAPGVIVHEPHGSGGFGYDPFVFDPEVGKTFAEMSGEEKDARSHRGNAFRALAAELRTGLS